MKKAALILSCAVIALSLAFGGHTVYMIKNPPHVGQRDRLSDDADNGYNLNMIMQARPENWKKIIGSPALSESEMPKLDGSTSTAAITAELFRQFFDYGDGKIAAQIWHTSEYEAYGNLIEQGTYIDGTYEKDSSKGLIFAPHPSDYYIRYAKEKGVELEIAPIAKDGFVFITHRDSPVDSLSVEQIQDIYSGKITNWKDAGGDDLTIKAYQRDYTDIQIFMEQSVMNGIEMIPHIGTTAIDDVFGLIEVTEEYENSPSGIGYAYRYFINNLYKNDEIKMLKIDGVEPSNENLISGKYPFSTNYYAVMRGDEPEGSPARRLRDFMLTPSGQDIVEMAGYCRVGDLNE